MLRLKILAHANANLALSPLPAGERQRQVASQETLALENLLLKRLHPPWDFLCDHIFESFAVDE